MVLGMDIAAKRLCCLGHQRRQRAGGKDLAYLWAIHRLLAAKELVEAGQWRGIPRQASDMGL